MFRDRGGGRNNDSRTFLATGSAVATPYRRADPAPSAGLCARERTRTDECKSHLVKRSLTIANHNCVAQRRGGEQRKANDRSAREEPDSAGCAGEPAAQWRSPDPVDADGKRS